MQQSHNYLFKYEGKIGIDFEKPNQFTKLNNKCFSNNKEKKNNYQYKTNTKLFFKKSEIFHCNAAFTFLNRCHFNKN